MRKHDAFGGQLLTFGVNEFRGNELVRFLPQPRVTPDEVVLPDGVLEAIERHVVRTAEQTDRLRAHGQHLKRGLLLYGPPAAARPIPCASCSAASPPPQ